MRICPRCEHANPDDANFCSSCGAGLKVEPEEATVTLSAVVAEQEEDDLARFLDGLPEGTGLLVARHGPDAGSSYRLDGEVTTAGRHPDSDIFFDDITVSRRHARFERDRGGYLVRDVGSLNGTYVNRHRVEEARLEHGDEVQVGRYRLSFVLGGHRDG